MTDHKRRATDNEELDESFKQCPAYSNHTDMGVIHKDLQEIKTTVAEMRDIVVAWQDAKSFFKLIRIFGEIMKWIVATGAAIGIIWYFIRGGK